MVSIRVCGRVSKLRYHTVLNSILRCLTVFFSKIKMKYTTKYDKQCCFRFTMIKDTQCRQTTTKKCEESLILGKLVIYGHIFEVPIFLNH